MNESMTQRLLLILLNTLRKESADVEKHDRWKVVTTFLSFKSTIITTIFNPEELEEKKSVISTSSASKQYRGPE
jgi:hypothetical protein